MRKINSLLQRKSYSALLEGARAASPFIQYDASGYVSQWQDNVSRELPFAEIEQDFSAGAGQELGGKFRAAHSSAALVVNSFGPWRCQPSSLLIAGETGFRTLQFEVTLPTGLRGTPPHLDVVAEGDSVVAVESKCTEWMASKPAVFARSYDQLRGVGGDSPWFDQMQELRANPKRYKFLDAAQLIKHAFGAMKSFGSRRVRLVYLYWEPANAADWAECGQHRSEADELAEMVSTSSVKLVPMSYLELWNEWERHEAPLHLPYLRLRYARAI